MAKHSRLKNVNFSSLEALLHHSIERGFPSAQLAIDFKGKRLYEKTFGFREKVSQEAGLELEEPIDYQAGYKADNHTLYDIASLTKIFSVTYLFQYLVSQKNLSLALTVEKILSSSSLLEKTLGSKLTPSVKRLTLYDLLTHSGGFPPNPLYYDPSYSQALYCQDRSSFLEKLLSTPLLYSPRTQALYSDVDYMLLTFLAEILLGESMSSFLSRVFWRPLAIEDSIGYTPLLSSQLTDTNIAATELRGNTRDGVISFPNIRTYPLKGEVQDEKAYHCMAGISGHAGLFANSHALLTLLKCMTEKEKIGATTLFFTDEVKNKFLTPTLFNKTFALGWRLNRDEGSQATSMAYMFGDYASPYAFGHTGWTGCLVMHDPTYDLSIAYLTNRKHTKVVNPCQDSNLFLGDNLPAGKYRLILNKIYEALFLV